MTTFAALLVLLVMLVLYSSYRRASPPRAEISQALLRLVLALLELLLLGGLIMLVTSKQALGSALILCGVGGVFALAMGHFVRQGLRRLGARSGRPKAVGQRDPTERDAHPGA